MARKWLTLTAVCTGVFMLLLDVTIVNVALPDIQADLGSSLSGLQWVIDAYALTLAALLLTSGTIADIIGRRRVFASGIVVFTLGSLACGLAPTIETLVAARALQGVGGAIMFATSLALLAQAFAPKERGVAFGVFGAVTGVSVAVGPVLGGILTSGLSWHWIFFVNIPVGIGALVITAIGVDESKAPGAQRIDWLGCLTFSAALAFLVFGLIRSHADGWGSVMVAGSLVLAAVLLVAFVVVERTVGYPMIDAALLRVPTFNGGLIAAWAISASMFSVLTYLVIYLQTIMGYSALEAGLRFLPFSGVVFVAAGVAGRLSDLVPVRWLIGPGFVLVALGLWLMRGTDPTGSWTQLVPGFIVAGIGTGLINPPLASTAVGVVEPARAGMASGINSTFRQIGIATGVALLGSLLASRFADQVGSALQGGPLASRADEIGRAVADGEIARVAATVPAPLRPELFADAGRGYANALDLILGIAALVAIVAAVVTFLLIRSRDFHDERGSGVDESSAAGGTQESASSRIGETSSPSAPVANRATTGTDSESASA
ncbi:MFS transporter [Gordonia sp. ABSL11-1]|uniref:MFS transporter n=1 Tax=Gordonia sp. ABSL11-1 TaxID=3053924 RepID=UPI00257441C1|nr:MFS transporter [Gordonia sp. ABSL11-1]MDL9945968.1 MFS transporter [Gordonia sp. ABSL11-1]